METIPSEMLRGHIDTIILLSLVDDDKHTNQIKEEIESRVDGQFELKQGTFYTCLQRITAQGYVTEYRSTSADGKRRKFYQLTEKGKSFIEDNKDKWLFSRNVIDSLIQVPKDKTEIDSVYSYKPKTSDEPTQQQIIENQAVEINKLSSKIEEMETKFQQITEEVTATEDTKTEEIKQDSDSDEDSSQENLTQENLTEIEKLLIFGEDYNSEQTATEEQTQAEDENVVQEDNTYNEQLDFDSIKTENSQQEETVEDPKIEFHIVEQNSKTEENIDKNTDDYESNNSSLIQQEYTQQQPIIPIFTTVTNEPDDYYNGEDAITHDYKTVLQKLFPNSPEVAPEPVSEPSPVAQPDASESVSEQPEPVINESEHDTDEDYPQQVYRQTKKQKRQIYKSRVRPEVVVYKDQSSSEFKYDFSEIYELAEKEGFKVKTSQTNIKKESGKIYINKLIFSSALTFYFLLLLETLVLAFTTRNISLLQFKHYGYFSLAIAIFPIISIFLYFIDPKRKVESIASFKSVLSFIFVVVLNLILIIFVYSILINIDFTDARQLMLYVFYPLIFVLNLPIYFFIKYLKLENQKFFS